MNGAPYEAPIVDAPPASSGRVGDRQLSSGALTVVWKMWFGYISRILTSVQYSGVSEYGIPLTGDSILASSEASKMLLDPAGALATLSVRLPDRPFEGMEWRLSSTQAVAALTLSVASGQTIKNPASALAAGGGVAYTYASTTSTWYRLY